MEQIHSADLPVRYRAQLEPMDSMSLFVVIVALLMILGSLSSIPLGGAGNHSGNSGKSSPFQPFYNQFSPAITGNITINIIPGNSEIQINGEYWMGAGH